MESVLEAKERARAVLRRLNWSGGLTKADVILQLLDQNLSLPDEVVEAIPEGRKFAGPDELLAAIPESAWEEHVRHEQEARGQTTLREQMERTRRFHT